VSHGISQVRLHTHGILAVSAWRLRKPAMGYILVDARMPYRDHIETRDLHRRHEHDQPLIVLTQQARWNKCDKIVRLSLA
jgi:CheY-like chemotaxis protein